MKALLLDRTTGLYRNKTPLRLTDIPTPVPKVGVTLQPFAPTACGSA